MKYECIHHPKQTSNKEYEGKIECYTQYKYLQQGRRTVKQKGRDGPGYREKYCIDFTALKVLNRDLKKTGEVEKKQDRIQSFTI